MVDEKEKTTALGPSVGADGEQPSQTNCNNSIPDPPAEINDSEEESQESL